MLHVQDHASNPLLPERQRKGLPRPSPSTPAVASPPPARGGDGHRDPEKGAKQGGRGMLPDSPPRTRGAVRLSGPQGGDLIEAEAPAAMSARPWPGFWTTRPTPTDPSTGSGGCSPTSPRPTWWGCCTAMGSAAST